MKSIFIRIFILSAVVALPSACAVSVQDEDLFHHYAVPTIVAKGLVFDKNSESPIEGVMLVLSAVDGNRVSKLESDTVYSDGMGRFTARLEVTQGISTYRLEAFDVDKDESGGTYAPGKPIDILLRPGSSAFDESRNAYLIFDNNFAMELAK